MGREFHICAPCTKANLYSIPFLDDVIFQYLSYFLWDEICRGCFRSSLERICLDIQSRLTNRPQYSIIYTLKDHRNDVIKCSKLKPQVSGFIAKFWTFYDVISMVYNSVDYGKLWLICFLQYTFIFIFLRSFSENHVWHVGSFPWSILS